MMKEKKLYYICIALALILMVLAFTVLGNTQILAPIAIVLGIYLLIGSIIKLCKTNDKLKNTVICMFDLLFWLP